MSVRTQYDEANNLYSLGDDIDGVFIPFVSVPGDSVRGAIASAQAAAETANPTTATAGGRVTGNTGDDFNPADFTDNGDGTYTRQSDGVTGRFSPSGFEPAQAA